MPGIEVQWIGSSCGRHGSYTFYRGFRLIRDGEATNYCLGEFYFVKNSSTQPICIAELQLVWYDASTDSKLASARLYFKPEDTPEGRRNNHGEDELLYADQKVVIKCRDMATWVCPGKEWNTGLSLPCEADFVQLNGSPKLSYMGTQYENKVKGNAHCSQSSGATQLHISTFPAYCRYMALRKRMSEGACFTMKQILSLGGMVAPNRSTKMVFCRESFHNPDLDKFELSIENKAPVLKGRPRKKKRLKIENPANRIRKNRFLAELNDNQHDSESQSPKSRVSDDDVGTDSDISEESGLFSEVCRPKKISTVVEKIAVTINNRPPLRKSQVSQPGPPPLQPSNQPQIPRLIPVTQVRLNTTAEPAVKAIMNIESKPPPLLKSEMQPKATATVVTAMTKVTRKPDSSPPQSVSTSWASLDYVNPVSTRSSTANTTVTMATSTKVSVTAAAATPWRKLNGEAVVARGAQGQDEPKDGGKESRQVRSCRVQDDSRVPMIEEQGKENVEMEKKSRKRLREPGDFSDIENCEDEDEKYFMKSLRDFMRSRNTPLGKIPALGFKKDLDYQRHLTVSYFSHLVNLWTMYNCTQKLGGYEMVKSKRLWRFVYDSLGGSTTITSAATYTRRHYEKLLLPYERHVRGQLSAMSKEKEKDFVPTSETAAVQKQKVMTHPPPQTPNLNTVPLKKEIDEVVVQNESARAQSRQPEGVKPLKPTFQPVSSHNPKLSVSSCSPKLPVSSHNPKLPVSYHNSKLPVSSHNPRLPVSSHNAKLPVSSHNHKQESYVKQPVEQHQVKVQPHSQSRQQLQPVLLHVSNPQENVAAVAGVKKIKVERVAKVEQCVGTSGHAILPSTSVKVDRAVKRDVIDLTDAEENEAPRGPPRQHRPAMHAHLPQVTSVCSHPLREHPQADQVRSRVATPQIQQPLTQSQGNARKLSAGELTAVADAHYKSQLATRPEMCDRQGQKEVKPIHSVQSVRCQPIQAVKPKKENLQISDQKFTQQQDETINNERLMGMKRRRNEELDAERISRLSPSHVKKRRTVNQPSQVSVDDHFEQWRRSRTQEVQGQAQGHQNPQAHQVQQIHQGPQVHPASRGVSSGHNTVNEITIVQERAVTPQYTCSQYIPERHASVTDSHVHPNPIVVSDSPKKHFHHNGQRQLSNHDNHNHGYHKQQTQVQSMQENTDHMQDGQFVMQDSLNHMQSQRHVRQDTHSHVPHSHGHVTQNGFHTVYSHTTPTSHVQSLLVKPTEECNTAEYYTLRVNPEDLSSRPPSLEMEMGDVFPTASSYVGAHFFSPHWAQSGEFIEYPPHSGYQLVPANDKMGQCSSSRIFMPPSIFPPMGMPPLSPPMLPPGHLVTSPDGSELHIHPHCMLGSYPGPCTHQMTSATANFPLLQG